MHKIWLSSPEISGQEQIEINKALQKNEISLGPALAAFKTELENFSGINASLLGSGTAALHLVLIALGIGAGDEVLCSTLTFAASINPVCYCGATPVFIDSENSTWNLCPNLLEEAIIDRKKQGGKPRAVIAVDLYGMPCDYSAIAAICKKYDLILIEDAAEGLGSTYQGKPLGSFGDAAILSFNANKIITTGGGGAVLSADKSITDQAAHLGSQARDNAEFYLHSKIGYNYRMNNLAAAMGLVQFRTLNNRVEGRRAVFANYQKLLSDIDVGFQQEQKGSVSNRWLSAFTFKNTSWEKIQQALREKNIESRPLWKPLHTQPVFKNALKYLNGVSDRLFSQGICLPSGSMLPQSDQESICKVIRDCIS